MRYVVKRTSTRVLAAVAVTAASTAILLWMGSAFVVLALGVGLFVIGSIIDPTARPDHASGGGDAHIGPFGDGGGGGGDSGGGGC